MREIRLLGRGVDHEEQMIAAIGDHEIVAYATRIV